MVKAEVKTPNKRKSIANDTPAKKLKVENGKTSEKPFTPKKQVFSPKNNQQASGKKFNKNNKQTNSDSPKELKPFAGTKQLKQGQQPKKEFRPKAGANQKSQESKKRRKNQFSNLIVEVKAKEGSKDAETIQKLNEKIEAITSRGEITKTARKKLSILKKLKTICEEGAEVAAAKSRALVDAAKAKKTAASKKDPSGPAAQPKKKKQVVKETPVKQAVKEVDDDQDSDAEEEDSDAEAEVSGEEDDDSDEVEGEDSDEAEGEEDSDEGEDDDDDDSDEEVPAPAPKKKPPVNQDKAASQNKQEGKPQPANKKPNLDQLKKTEIVKTGQKRFVLFVGNIPYDTTKQDIAAHFSKAGEIVDIRIPSDKGSNKPRGFGYVEVKDETAYEKCLSMHHSQMKGRRINVMYTQGGKKKGDDKKKEIKAKNMKLHALRRQGKLAGSVKETQKRSFRRNKNKPRQTDEA